MLKISRDTLRYWLPFVLGVTIIAAGAFMLRRSIDPPFGRELYPGPDAYEYAEMARRFAFLEGFGLHVSDAVVPSRYPALFPLVLCPVARITGGDAIRYSTAMALFGSVSIVLAGLLGTLASGYRRAGLLLAALLALSGSHIHASHVIMSDLLMLMLFQAAAIVALLHRRYWFNEHRTSYVSILLAGLLAGSLVAVRTPGAVLAAGFGLFYLLLLFRLLRKRPDGFANYKRLLAVAALLFAGACIPVAFELLSRKVQFGSPLTDPYAYYIPSFRPGSGFEPLSRDWIIQDNDGTRLPNWQYFGRMVLGTDDGNYGMRLPWKGALVFAGLAVFFGVSLRRRDGSTFLIFIVGPAALLMLHMMYYWQEGRLVLVPVFVSLFLVAYLVALSSVGLGRLLQRVVPAKSGEIIGIGVFCLAGIGLLYMQKQPVDRALHMPIPPLGLGGELRRQVQEKIDELPVTGVPPIVVTNAGTLLMQNLIFPGAESKSARVLSLTDSFNHDEHVWRVTHQEPYGIPEGHEIETPRTVLKWQRAEQKGSGKVSLQENVLKELRQHAGKSHVLILLREPDAETQRALKVWQEQGDWTITELAQLNRFQLLQAKPPSPAVAEEPR